MDQLRTSDSVARPIGRFTAFLTAAFILGSHSPAHGQLVITPTFDSSITSSANSAQLQADINQAIGIYQSLFTDNVNLSILFRYSTTAPNGNPLGGGLLAQSNYIFYSLTYSNYITALNNDTPKSANDVQGPGQPAGGERLSQ